MKNILTLVVCILIMHNVKAQTNPHNRYNYSYDANGNRIKRNITIVMKKMGDDDLIKTDTIAKNSNTQDGKNKPVNAATGKSNLSVFPNPTSSFVNVNLSNDNSNDAIQSIKIIDTKGSVMYYKLNPALSSEIDINLFAAGVYMLFVQTNNELIKYEILKTY